MTTKRKKPGSKTNKKPSTSAELGHRAKELVQDAGHAASEKVKGAAHGVSEKATSIIHDAAHDIGRAAADVEKKADKQAQKSKR